MKHARCSHALSTRMHYAHARTRSRPDSIRCAHALTSASAHADRLQYARTRRQWYGSSVKPHQRHPGDRTHLEYVMLVRM
jgi:hypothetical protein